MLSSTYNKLPDKNYPEHFHVSIYLKIKFQTFDKSNSCC